METMPPFQVVAGQRQLAAIMFTDAVSFSAQMNAQEVATLHRMERDMDVMRRAAAVHNGTVLKSTGDGLLISFGSAVQAVSCALEIQRGFAPRLQPGADPTSLRHRVGIHLGDVFASGGDIMGDGVNIAARIVNEAPPGGIVVSQMVHELVRNKLSLHSVSLGPRHLKNIRESVALFRLLLDPPPVASPAGPESTEPDAPAAPAAPARRSRRAMGVAILALVVAGWFVFRAQQAYQRDLAESQRKQAAFVKALQEVSAPGAPAGAPPAAGFDFAGATTGVPAVRRQPPEPAERLDEAQALNARLLTWLADALRGYHRDRPLDVRGLGDPAFTGATVFTNAQGQLFLAEGGASRQRTWEELGEPAQAAIIAAALERTLSVPEEIRRGAGAFAYLRGRPELARALRR